MPDDLTALLRREIEAAAFSPGLDLDIGYATLDALAARLAI